MGQLNLYRIDKQKHEEFEEALAEKYKLVGTPKNIRKIFSNQEIIIELSFFIDIPDGENSVEWNWLLNFFGDDGVTSRSNPKAILFIKIENEVYVCTYGFSFFIVDKYCDTEFAFDFARRIKYKEIKTTTLLSPSSKRNKAVNTYMNYDNLEFDSGESFAKLKVQVDLPEEFELFKACIEVGHSIKFELSHDSVESVISLLFYVKDTLDNSNEIYKIPVFNRVTDKEIIEELNSRFAQNLTDRSLSINLSELDVIGVTEVFNNNDSSYEMKYRRKSKPFTYLSSKEIVDFIGSIGLSLYDGIKKVKIISYNSGASVRTDTIYNLIDHVDDEKRCLLSKGKWYYYNDDYLRYLADSLAEIDTIYDPQYDYNDNLHEQFILEKYTQEMCSDEYKELDTDEAKQKLKKKYYRERAYNLHISTKFGFECYDRVEEKVGGSKIELMDLYKDETLFAVKFGNASSILCYVVDQSMTTLKLYKQHLLKNLPNAKKFGIWMLLDRRKRLDEINGRPNINQLDMLALKNKIDSWKKEVRILGYTPIIMLNYFNCP